MSIQYGSLPITEIKYCDSQGALKDVSSVVRNGNSVWNRVRHNTTDNGVWTCTDRGLILIWSAGDQVFMNDGSARLWFINSEEEVFKSWMFQKNPISDIVECMANEYATSLTFIYGSREYNFTWSAT